MKLKRHHENPILEKNPDQPWEQGSVLNPSVLYEDGLFRMVYRATNDTHSDIPGQYMSSIGYAESTDGVHFTRFPEPLIYPDQPYEIRLGCEDPRVTNIDGEYFLYYTAVGEADNGDVDVRIALATSHDFKTWHKHGIVGPRHTTSKAAALFPEKIGGKYVMFYTWMSDSPMSTIMEARFNTRETLVRPPAHLMVDDIERYEENAVFKPPESTFRGAEVGAVPIKTDIGWLFIYCPANTTDHPEWTISAALLDLHDPRKIIAESEEPILKPEAEEELHGIVNNVTFPEGAVVVGDELYVYYGSGDQGICLATCNLNQLLKHLKLRTR
jgi:beta-1,2-mannobiose phosphorylase / 1,2-beta-oligomannan phosphorylase